MDELDAQGDESLSAMQEWSDRLKQDLAEYVGQAGSLEEAVKGLENWFAGRRKATEAAYGAWLAAPMLAALLAGFADVQADVGAEPSAPVANAQPRMTGRFDLPFTEAIKAFVDRGVVGDDDLAAIRSAAVRRAQRVGGLTDDYAQEIFRDSMTRALQEGKTSNDWLTDFEERFAASGLGVGGASPSVQDSAHHLRLVFRQNAFTAYSAGRFVQHRRQMKARPFWQYLTVAHGAPVSTQITQYNVRPEHAALDGMILPADDPHWKRYYPPLGFGCRCQVVSVSREEMEAEGLEVTPPDDVPNVPVPAGFNVDPAEAFFTGKGGRIDMGTEGGDALRKLLGDGRK